MAALAGNDDTVAEAEEASFLAAANSSSGGSNGEAAGTEGDDSPPPPPPPPLFQHPQYELVDNNLILRKDVPQPASAEEHHLEETTVLDEVVSFVTGSMIAMGFQEIWLPDSDSEAKCPIYCTHNWEKAPKLLVVLINQVNSKPGLWSRSLCFSHGLNAGSMLPTLEAAIANGYGVMVLNPNSNSVTVEGQDDKIPIEGSTSPEEHVLGVWDKMIQTDPEHGGGTAAEQIFLLAYGNGATLASEIVQRQIAVASGGDEPDRIVAVATIESSKRFLEKDDAEDVRGVVASRFLNWEQSEFPEAFRITATTSKLGCTCLSVGQMGPDQTVNVAWSVSRAVPAVFRFYEFASTYEAPPAAGTTTGGSGGGAVADKSLGFMALAFARHDAATHYSLDPDAAESPALPQPDEACMSPGPATPGNGKKRPSGSGGAAEDEGVFTRFGRLLSNAFMPGDASVTHRELSNKLRVKDFDLLRVVGKGAFGKVMLVRKKTEPDKGEIFAMKVLKKSMIAAKGQVEHTKSERSILCEIHHPYIVCLRYAFQSDEKLYLITDYYNGGSLFYHLRKSRGFSENRARFYAAELCLALSHLHEHHIIYRDLKLENVLMDQFGHIALTDFGLSKEGVDDVTLLQLTTFCGTAEYIAPELLKGQKYGAGVDWWSFGVLLYEMMGFRTPFYDKNRKLMFHGIINNEPLWQPHFSQSATQILHGLLRKPPQLRLGSGQAGADEIKAHPFFSPIDWDLLLQRKVEPPFKPDVNTNVDVRYVPKTYLNQQPRDSVDKSALKSTSVEFDNFTYVPKNPLDQEPEEN